MNTTGNADTNLHQHGSSGFSRAERWCDVGVRYFVLVAGILAFAGYLTLYGPADVDQPIHSDGYSYFVYIPSILIYHDITLDAMASDWYGGEYPPFTGIRRWPATGHLLNPHPIGTAILMTPFVVIGHALTRWSNFPPDGFSFFYQHAAGFAGMFYMLAGLAVLRRTLARHFSSRVVLATLAATTWGTNLFHYGVFDSVFSHVFAFFLVCVLLELTEKWWAAPTLGRSLGLGLVAALLFLTRHTDIVFLALVPLYGITNVSSARERIAALWRRRYQLGVIGIVALAGVSPQLAIYRHATSLWLPDPYAAVGTGFQFSSPHLFGVLFSTQKGLFFWSPVLLLAIAGLCVARGAIRNFAIGASVVFVVNTWLIASWSDWQFGASYGHRAFTDGAGLFAIFIASALAWTDTRPRLAHAAYLFTVLAVLLSIAQMIQYWAGVSPHVDTTWDQYRALFLRFR